MNSFGSMINLARAEMSRDPVVWWSFAAAFSFMVGLVLAAKAGYKPEAGVTLWQKMQAASKGAPPQFLSTHPSGNTRIHEIQANLPKVMPLYERSK